MTATHRFLAFAAPLVCAAALALPTADPKAEFESALAQVQKHVDAGRWKDAKALLGTTLATHASEPYVRAHLEGIRNTLSDCSFELAVPNRGVKGVFRGEVASYDAKRGEIELRWEAPKKDGDSAKFPGEDFERTEVGFLLRAPFDGLHSLELSGKAIGQIVPRLIGCFEAGRHYEAALDAGSQNRLFFVASGERQERASMGEMFNVGRPYTLKLTVSATQVEASLNGKRLVVCDKHKDEFGRVGFKDVLDPRKISAKGKVRVAWIDEQIAAFRAKERVEFDKTYDVKADLPEPLR